jgi:glycosyltransferase involved in cell wall biosynthesis
VYLWQSGTTLEFDRAQPWSAARVRALFRSRIPNLLARRFTDHLVSGPASMLEYYATVGGVKRDKLVLLYNDVNTATYRPPPADVVRERRGEAERRFAVPAGHRVVLFVHRMSPVRRTRLYFPYLVRRLEERFGVRDLVVLVAGGGPELDAVVAEAEALGVADRCRFLGSVPNAELPALYAVADVFIHPTYNEGFPRVILEAMASGLPVVTTNAGGTAELLGPLQQEFVVDRDDRDGFVERLARLLGSPGTRASLGRENLETVRRYSTEVVAEMYDSVLFG